MKFLDYSVIYSTIFQLVPVFSQGGGGSTSSTSTGGSTGIKVKTQSRLSCTQQCDVDYPNDSQERKNCSDKCSTTVNSQTLIIVFSVIGVLVLIIALFCLYKYMQRKKKREEILVELENKKTNESGIESEIKVDKNQLYKNLSDQEWEMSFIAKDKKYKVDDLKIDLDDNHDDIQIQGKDEFGEWSSKGTLVKGQPFRLNFLKDYKDKQKAGQIGSWENLVYESIYSPEKYSFSGKWYYKGFEHDEKYSGKWNLNMVLK